MLGVSPVNIAWRELEVTVTGGPPFEGVAVMAYCGTVQHTHCLDVQQFGLRMSANTR